MSLSDDQSAELDAQVDRAWRKCRYGKKYSPAYEVAHRIKCIRHILRGEQSQVRRSFVRAKNLLLRVPQRVKSDDDYGVHVLRPADNVDTSLYVACGFVWPAAACLLFSALRNTKELRQIADALDTKETDDPRQIKILKAYEDCIHGRYDPTIAKRTECCVTSYVPTLAQLRDCFAKRFGTECWRSDYAVRKTLKLLGLPLSAGKCGPRRGSGQFLRSNRKGNRRR